jgi:ribosomal protein S18 acetylase RimI-like enzyme
VAGITIAPAGASDVDALVEIETRCFEAGGFSRRQLRYLATRARGTCLLLRVDGRPAGYISCLARARGTTLRVYSLAVLPAARGRGAATRLLERAIAHARANGLTALTLEARTTNLPATRLYAKTGFITTSLLPRYYPDGSDAYRMRLDLPSPPHPRE